MDPLSAILLTANLLAVVDNLYRGISILRRAAQDPKLDGFYVRLITEKARFAEWKRRMGIETSDDVETLISKLPEDAQKSFRLILAPMQKYIIVSEKLFVKYRIQSPDTVDSHQSFRAKLRRIDLLMDGQQHLNDILDTLKNCNDGLVTIAPPPPGYHISPAGDDSTLEISDEAQYTVVDDSRQPQPPQSTSQPFPRPTIDRRAETTPQNTNTPTIKPQDQGSTKKVFHPVVELLYSTCLRILRSMVVHYPNSSENFQAVGDRLQIWGTGLFHGQVSIDQAFNQSSRAIKLLRKNIAGVLADVAVTLRHTLFVLGEADTSASTLQLRELFSIPEISLLPLGSPFFPGSVDEALEGSASLDSCSEELAALIECLFCTLSTTEMVLKETIAHQRQNLAIDERDLRLIKSDSEISPRKLTPAHAKDLLRVDLQYIAAMQESLKDSKFAKYMDHKNLKFDAMQLHNDLEDQSRQMRYWTSMLEGSPEDQSMTQETQTAMILNLTRIARTFAAGFKSAKTTEQLDRETQAILDQCLKDYPDLEAALTSPLPESEPFTPVDVLKSGNVELRKLAGSKAPEKTYTKDFALSEKAKLAAAEERASSTSIASYSVS